MQLELDQAFGSDMAMLSGTLPSDPAAQNEVSEHLRMLVRAIMQTDDAVMIATACGIIEFVNPAFERHSGYSAKEVVGQTPSLLKSGEHPPEFFAALWEALRKGEVFRAVFINRRKTGYLYYEEKTITSIHDTGGEITHFVATGRDVTARVLADARQEHLANFDLLTQLPNRSLFMDRLRQAIRRGRRDARRLSLLLIDLDRFKRINDTLGHSTGDRLLFQVAQRIGEVVREQDAVARLGGDEFTILLEGVDGQHAGNRVAEALMSAFARPFEIEGHVLYAGISIGIATYPDDGEDIESLVRHADIAMYQAKASGRGNCVNFSSVMEEEMLEDLSIEASLRSALANGEFEIYYQPIICPEERQMVALEALLRWHSPQHGEVPPARFIPMLEENGLIASVGRWVLQTACTQIKAREQRGFAPVILAVNLSGRQFRDGNLISDVQGILQATGLAPGQLELEITENILIEAASVAGRTLHALAALGVRLAIDDFGTGYSSLSYLRRFPIRTLKIDRSFVSEMESSPDAVAIIKTIIDLADNLGLEVVAEGVETAEQLALLSAFGCAKVQGYWFSRPVPMADLEGLTELAAAKIPAVPRLRPPCSVGAV